MVGRKTSPRCENCRVRKVKCDLAQPACTQCIKRQIECPGYDSSSRFFVYQQQDDYLDLSSSGSSPCAKSDSSSNTSYRRRHRLVVARAPALSPTETLREELVLKLSQRNVSARFMVISERAILKHIPRRLGSNRALDDAVKCICSDSTVTPGPKYSEALSSLQTALDDHQRCVSSETLGAAILLQMFEHSVGHADCRWIIHANGVINMLQLRGPSRIRSELDQAIVRAQVGNIWFKAMQEGSDCFLASQEWKRVIDDTFDANDGASKAWSAMIRSGLALPGIVRRYANLNPPTNGICLVTGLKDEVQEHPVYAALIMDLCKSRDELAELRNRLQPATNIDFDDPCETTKLVEQPRLSHASRMAVNVFSVIIEFMLKTVLGTGTGGRVAYELFDKVSIAEYMGTAERFQTMIDAAESSLKILHMADHIAATQTAMLTKITLTRVLQAPLTHASSDRSLNPIMERLCNVLNGHNLDEQVA